MRRFLLALLALVLICPAMYSQSKTYSVQFDTTGYSAFKLEFGFRTVEGEQLDTETLQFGALTESDGTWSASSSFQIYWSVTSKNPLTLLLGFSDQANPKLVNANDSDDKVDWSLTWENGNKTIDSSNDSKLSAVAYSHAGEANKNIEGLSYVTATVTFSPDQEGSALEKFSLGKYKGSISLTVKTVG